MPKPRLLLELACVLLVLVVGHPLLLGESYFAGDLSASIGFIGRWPIRMCRSPRCTCCAKTIRSLELRST